MAYQFPFRTRVAGTGSYLPPKVLTNFDLEKMVDTNNQWIVERTGIERRHIAEDGLGPSDLAYEASLNALKDAGLTAQDIDCIIFATVSPDKQMPSAACYLQARLGCKNVMAFDVNAACSGFIYSLSIADQFIKTGVYKNILVIGAEVLHPFVDYKDRETCILFGDAAGAWVVSQASPEDKNIILGSHNHAEGSLAELLVLDIGGSKERPTADTLKSPGFFVKMKGREIFKNAVRAMGYACKEVIESTGESLDKVDWLVPHQANARIIEAVAGQFDFPTSKVVVTVNETGNTSAASIPAAFQIAREDGRIKRGQLILLTAFGAGLTSGSLLLRF